jgi:single-strand DNA-binding protein
MNSLTVLAFVNQAPIGKTIGDKQIATFPIQVAAYRDDDPPMDLNATAWGTLAVDAVNNIKRQYYVLTGRLRLEKNRLPDLQITSFHTIDPLNTPHGDPGVNVINLVGRAGRDPEVRYFESGSMVANLSIAVNRNSRDDEPDWFNLEIWGKQAQVAADYVRKGSLLGITGSFKVESWTDRSTGEGRSKPVIRVDRLDLLGSKRDADNNSNWNQNPPTPDDDDIPF